MFLKITCTSGGQAAPRDEVKRSATAACSSHLGMFVRREMATESHGSCVGVQEPSRSGTKALMSIHVKAPLWQALLLLLHYLLTFLRLTFVSLASIAYQRGVGKSR